MASSAGDRNPEESEMDRILDDTVPSFSSCGCFFGFGSRLSRSNSIRYLQLKPEEQDEDSKESWMMKKVKKIRRILKAVAVRKWRSFIDGIVSKRRSVKFHYDPRSYALNFDEGIGKDGGGGGSFDCRARCASPAGI